MTAAPKHTRRTGGVALLVLLLVSGTWANAQPTGTRTEDWAPPIVPAPHPFTLNSYDVIDAVWLIRRARFLQWWDGTERPRTIVARTVRSVWVDHDPEAYEGHRNRYDILLNGEPADWNNLYVEFGGDMINLRMLYTYRNQQPVPDLPYRLRWP